MTRDACFVFGWFVLLPGELSWFGRSMAWCAAFLANVPLTLRRPRPVRQGIGPTSMAWCAVVIAMVVAYHALACERRLNGRGPRRRSLARGVHTRSATTAG
jgi:hypothetical protein